MQPFPGTAMNEPSAFYTLSLRSDAARSASTDRADLLARLLRIPGVQPSDDLVDSYEFGDRDEHGVMSLEFFVCRGGVRVPAEEVTDEEGARCHEVEVRIPRPWVLDRGPRVFALVFMLAEWAKWTVFDPQIGDTLEKEAVLSGLVAMRQKQRDLEASAAGRASAKEQAPPPDYVPQTQPAPPPPKPARGPWWKRQG